MFLKIFIKKDSYGKYVKNHSKFKEWYFEGDEIMKYPLGSDPENVVEGFSFLVKNKGSVITTFDMVLHEQGYELRNDSGILIEKYVTTNPDPDNDGVPDAS